MRHVLDARGVSGEPKEIGRWAQGSAEKPVDGPPAPPSGVVRRPVQDFRRRHLAVVALLALLSPVGFALAAQPSAVAAPSRVTANAATARHGAIPLVRVAPYKLFGLVPIQPFGVLVGLALVVGYQLARRRARLTGLDADLMADSLMWVAVGGFVVGHLVSVIFYFPERIAENPLVLVYVWSGLSSFGGFIGGIAGGLIFYRRRGLSVLEHADAVIFGLLPGWIFGRMGCSVVHDHPGKITDFILGVHCAQGPCPLPWAVGQTRHDLGLYELALTILLTIVLYSLRNVRPFRGFHPALMLLLYSPVRFMFDYLRTADTHYLGLTPGQYFAVAMFAVGVGLTLYGLRLRARGVIPGKIPAGLSDRELKDYLAEQGAAGSAR